MNAYITEIPENIGISFEDYFDQLSEERILKVNSFKFYDDKCRSLFGELLLRYSIKDFTNSGIGSSKLTFEFNDFGKPELVNYPDIKFSDEEIGADIEEKTNLDFIELSGLFHQRERSFICSNTEQMRDKFFDIWTSKESYVKLIGMGLTIPLESFYIDPSNMNVVVENSYNTTQKYHIQKLEIHEGYACSICTQENKRAIIRSIPIEKILEL